MNFYEKLTNIVGKDKIKELLEDHKKRNSIIEILEESENVIRALCVSYLVSERKQWISIKDNALIDLMAVDKNIFQSILDKQCKLFGGAKGKYASAATCMGIEYRTFLMLSDLGSERFAKNNLTVNNNNNIDINNDMKEENTNNTTNVENLKRDDNIEMVVNNRLVTAKIVKIDRTFTVNVEANPKNKMMSEYKLKIAIDPNRISRIKEKQKNKIAKQKLNSNASSRNIAQFFFKGETHKNFKIIEHHIIYATSKKGGGNTGKSKNGNRYDVEETLPNGSICASSMTQTELAKKLGKVYMRNIQHKMRTNNDTQTHFNFNESSGLNIEALEVQFKNYKIETDNKLDQILNMMKSKMFAPAST